MSAVWYGRSAVVQRALRVISTAGMVEGEAEFARQFGMTSRHLRRLFVSEVGQTPKQIAMARRLDFARKLVGESRLPMAIVAETAGFASVRRFNDAFAARFRKAPSAMRGKVKMEGGMVSGPVMELSLAYRPPMDWGTLLGFFRTHHLPGIEAVAGNGFERVFRMGKKVGWWRAEAVEGKHVVKLSVVGDASVLFAVSQRVRQMFDLDSDPLLVANAFQAEPVLDRVWKRYPGLRLARGWDPFETAVRTILGQLVSVSRGQELARQLIEGYGEKVRHPVTGEAAWVFPSATVLAGASLDGVGTTGQRKRTIREFARRVASGEMELNVPREAEEMKGALLSIPGIGPWSAEYISLRALGDTDAFPGKDLILARAVEKHPEMRLETVRPWRSYAAVYLWRHYADALSKARKKKE